MTKRTIPWSMALPLGIVFLLDSTNPWGWPICLCYVLCILLAVRWNYERLVSSLAILATILTVLGLGLSAAWGVSSAAVLVRGLAIALCWITADLVVRLSQAFQVQAQLTRELAIKRDELDTEKKLRVRESRYKVYMDHASDAVFLYNSQAMILDVNAQACESLGRTREELIGQTPPFFARIDSLEFLSNLIAMLNRGQPVSFDGVHQHKVHGEFPVEVRIRPFTVEGERLALGTVRNITERKRIEAELRFSEQKFRDLADAIPQIVWISDPELNIQYFNARAMEFSGVPTTELLSDEQWLRFVHPDDRPAVEEMTKRTLETGVTEDSEIRLRRHDGEYRWHICRQFASRNSRGEIKQWYGTCTDIELQKRDEAALRDSEQRFVGFMKHFPGFAWIKNLDGHYIFANNRFEQLVEGRHDSVRGLTDDEIFLPQQAEAFRLGDLQAIENSSGIHEFQTVTISNREDAQFFVSKFPILGPQGKPLFVGGMAIDVTKEKQSELEIAVQNRIMERIATRSSLNEILELIVELMEDRIPDSICSILLYDAHENRVRFGAGQGLPEAYNKTVDGLTMGPEVGCCGAAIHRREPVIAQDVLTSPLWKDFRELASRNGIRSCWSVPIFSRPCDDDSEEHRQVLGTFAIYKPIAWEPRDSDVQKVAMATYLASVAIEREADLRSLRQSEQRYRALVDNAPIGI